ncbi:uracil-DNA glycosylase [Desulfosarcina sp. OttesenSCG-928-G10]|nr:uracil-DNA glycosylase [Desulfosarcina sp. OttesenSCG-928-G10]MDL2321071.1 uracil-DNA glycosylase [Desulfosarcina sp. OttesenSCG-928-B08]
MTSETTVNCRSCQHYFITWDPHLPHGCRAMGFKSPVLPSILVFRHSGQICLQYESKD